MSILKMYHQFTGLVTRYSFTIEQKVIFIVHTDWYYMNTFPWPFKRQAKTKAGDLKETGIELELMHLQKPNESFEVDKFYKVSYTYIWL